MALTSQASQRWAKAAFMLNMWGRWPAMEMEPQNYHLISAPKFHFTGQKVFSNFSRHCSVDHSAVPGLSPKHNIYTFNNCKSLSNFFRLNLYDWCQRSECGKINEVDDVILTMVSNQVLTFRQIPLGEFHLLNFSAVSTSDGLAFSSLWFQLRGPKF